MPNDELTRELILNLLNRVHEKQAQSEPAQQDSYLIAQDAQYLGRITPNQNDTNSILNPYGPYGSRYSTTSIFNPYSRYGSRYGEFSLNNQYCSLAPRLFIQGRFLGHVSANRYVSDRIPTDAFLYTLQNDLPSLLSRRVREPQD